MKQLSTLFGLILFISLFIGVQSIHSQLQDGAEAPDWTLTDLDGNTHSLYDELDAGRQVYLVFSATWCGPCWSYHNSGHMESIYEDFGPNGTNEARVYFLEADLNTAEACLYGPSGCNGTTQGDWVDGIPFPIINLTASNGGSLPGEYNISFFPTVYTICPDKRIFLTGQASSQVLETYMTSCDMAPSSVNSYDEICFEDQTGGIDVEVIPGHGNISYSWSNGSNNQNLSNVGQGVYTLTATDANGVFIEVDGEVGGPDAPLNIIEEELNLEVPCFGDAEGTIELLADGGTPGYEALWDDGTTGFSRSNLPEGSYEVEVTDANGCLEIQSYDVTEPPLLTLELTRINENCDQGDGVVIATAGGGTPSLQYDIGFGPSNNNSFTDLIAGNYSLTVTDANGCEEVDNIEIENLPAPEAIVPAEEELDCIGNELIIDASNSEVESGTTIEWSTTDGNIVGGGNSLTPTVDAAGTYTLFLSNSSSCTDEATMEVTLAPDQPVADAGDAAELDCDQSSVTLGSNNSSSGPDYQYEWTDESGEILNTTQFVDVSEAGTYYFSVVSTVTGCESIDSVEVIQVSNDIEVAVEADGVISCDQTVVEVSGEGSTTGGNISYSWLDEMGNEISTELTASVSVSGSYTFIVFDEDNGCSNQEVLMVGEDIVEPDLSLEGESIIGCDQEPVELSITTSVSNPVIIWWQEQNGDLVEVDSGMTAEFSEAGNYEVIVMNTENGCSTTEVFSIDLDDDVPQIEIATPAVLSCDRLDLTLDAEGSSQGGNIVYSWSTSQGNIVSGENSSTPVVDAAGSYTLTLVNEDNGCESSLTVEVESYDEAPTAELVIGGEGWTVDFGADVEGVVTSYSWDFGDGSTSNVENGTHTYVENGQYDICLTIENDCGEETYCQSVTIDGEVLSASGSVNSILCAGEATGSIDLMLSGGFPPYTVEWNTGDTVSQLDGLSAGLYTVTIRDSEGGEEVLEFEVEEPDPIIVTGLNIQSSSSSEDNGEINFEVEGGVSPYTYSWSNGATTKNIENLAPGDYYLTIEDANGCVEELGPFTVGVLSSVLNNTQLSLFEIYPNPTQHYLIVEVELEKQQDVQFQILAPSGRLLWNQEFGSVSNLREKVSLQDWPSGLYYLQILTREGQRVRPFVKF
jgi:PKD repeat protein